MAALCVLLAFTPDIGTAFAAEAKKAAASPKQVMQYDVYAGGFRVVSADLAIDLGNKTRYDLRLGAKTYGLLAKLAPWSGTFETVGWYDSKTSTPQPEKHSSDTVFRNEREVVEFLYNKDGSFKEYRVLTRRKKACSRRSLI